MTTKSSPSDSSPSNPNGVTGKLSNWISTTKLADIPPQIRQRAKYLLLDGLACALVGSHLPWSETASKAVFNMEPTGSCPVIGWGEHHRLSPLAAAILNSTYIQGFELDDYHSNAPLHSNSLLIPALLSASKLQPAAQPVSGSAFLLAYIVGCEVGPRIGLALHGADLLSRGWHSGAVQGPSASAAAVSSLLQLPPNQVEDALGIACTQAGGLMSAQFGSMAKRMQHGFASRNGLFAALMAQGGYTGINAVYETPYGGFLSCFSQGASFDPPALPAEICRDLGQTWELENIRVKLHASMAALHGTIDCAANLQAKHPDRFADPSHIAHIETKHSRAAFEHGGWTQPEGTPLTSTAAQMSIAYAAAAQLTDGQVLMAQFGADKLNRPDVVALMRKVQPMHEAAFDQDRKKDGWRTIMTVSFDDGHTLVENVAAPRGIRPAVSNEDIVRKWRDLVGGVVSEERMRAIEECVLGLDERQGAVEELSLLLEAEVGRAIEA